mmetsp:Transcript_11486/g.29396  ORF Transcript_11486/g.29396 Transcript_11486/m.29396 type:complete len:200 (-) Transcript_11486:1262-1861(-)
MSFSDKPCSVICLGTMYLEAMASFSLSVYPGSWMTSIRSSSGAGMVSIELAVAMKRTLERSYGTVMYRSTKVEFCAGSSTSSIADDGSPETDEPRAILSISSSSTTGSLPLTSFIPWISRPGCDPTYVRLKPRMSDSSRIPPSEMRRNSRPRHDAIDLPREVLPTPGGPTRQRIVPVPLGFRWCTATYSTIRRFTLSSP